MLSYQPRQKKKNPPIPSLGDDHADRRGAVIRRQCHVSAGARRYSLWSRGVGLAPDAIDKRSGGVDHHLQCGMNG